MPAYVRERWPVAVERAQRKTAQAVGSVHAERLVQAALRAPTQRQRVVWMHKAAEAWAKPLAAVAACRSGCDHCCHIPVTISSTEAQLLSQASGRKAVRPARAVRADQCSTAEGLQAAEAVLRDVARSPCPFLADGRCSVYAARPAACRLLLNMDDDDLLCRLVDDLPVPVPYANATQLKGWTLMVQPGAELADIRAFFP